MKSTYNLTRRFLNSIGAELMYMNLSHLGKFSDEMKEDLTRCVNLLREAGMDEGVIQCPDCEAPLIRFRVVRRKT